MDIRQHYRPTDANRDSVIERREWTALWRQRGRALAAGECLGLDLAGQGALVLAREGDGRRLPEGTVVSPVHEPGLAFDNVVASWQATAPPGTRLTVAVRARPASGWTGWYTLGTWGGERRSIPGQADGEGRVDVDTLKLRRPATALQYRIALATDDPAATPALRGVSVVVAHLERRSVPADTAVLADAGRDLDVPRRSQLLEAPAIARKICSPVSLAMVLGYWGVERSVLEVADGVFDHGEGIWGNWPFNTAYAASLGLDAYVDRFTSLAQLEAEIARGCPAIVSINFPAGALAGAHLEASSGHILVVRGFTPEGNVVVNDPFAPDEAGVRRVYDRAQFASVWLINGGGLVYLLRPIAPPAWACSLE